MNAWASAFGLWSADYCLLATILILVALLVMRFLRQPVRRLTGGWITMGGLTILAVICCLPFWPRVPILPPNLLTNQQLRSHLKLPKARCPCGLWNSMVPPCRRGPNSFAC
jgi:hypothetical protein